MKRVCVKAAVLGMLLGVSNGMILADVSNQKEHYVEEVAEENNQKSLSYEDIDGQAESEPETIKQKIVSYAAAVKDAVWGRGSFQDYYFRRTSIVGAFLLACWYGLKEKAEKPKKPEGDGSDAVPKNVDDPWGIRPYSSNTMHRHNNQMNRYIDDFKRRMEIDRLEDLRRVRESERKWDRIQKEHERKCELEERQFALMQEEQRLRGADSRHNVVLLAVAHEKRFGGNAEQLLIDSGETIDSACREDILRARRDSALGLLARSSAPITSVLVPPLSRVGRIAVEPGPAARRLVELEAEYQALKRKNKNEQAERERRCAAMRAQHDDLLVRASSFNVRERQGYLDFVERATRGNEQTLLEAREMAMRREEHLLRSLGQARESAIREERFERKRAEQTRESEERIARIQAAIAQREAEGRR